MALYKCCIIIIIIITVKVGFVTFWQLYNCPANDGKA